MRARAVMLTALAALAAAIAAGCGGGGDGERLTREEYIQQADAICADVNQQIEALGEPTSLQGLATIGAEAVSATEQGLDALRELQAPEEFEAQVNEAYDLLERQNELGREVVDAAEAGDEAEVNRLIDEISTVDEQADQIAQDLGLQECGKDGLGEETTTSTTEAQALTREEWIEQADAICAEANSRIDAIADPQSAEELATRAEEVIAISEEQLGKLEALTPPPELEPQVGEAIGLIRQQIELVREIATAAVAGDQAQVEAILAEGESLDQRLDALAREIGLTECGSE
jgi:hypothetical protein